MDKKEYILKCPTMCENGKSFHSTYGTEKLCGVCNGKGTITNIQVKLLGL